MAAPNVDMNGRLCIGDDDNGWSWYKSYGRDPVDGSPTSACEDCGRYIRKGGWQLVQTIDGYTVGAWCRRCGWPRWEEALVTLDVIEP